MDDGDTLCDKKIRKPRKLMKITPSKYEITEALHVNKTYWNSVFEKINSSNKTTEDESTLLANVLPRELYEKVCSTLHIPCVAGEYNDTKQVKAHLPRRLIKEPMLSYRKCIHIDREMDSDTDVELNSSDSEAGEVNVHQELLRKPEREQITWSTHYLKPEREDEKTLVKKADDLTDRIAREFCEYMKQLGGDQQSKLFTPKAIKELFQIEFDTHVARSLKVVPKELPAIEEKIAIATGNPEKSRYAALEREISKDIKAEKQHDRLRAFGRSLSLHEQYQAPRNNTKRLWRSARHVPKDLVTLKTVWEGITNLRSVKEYCRWMIEHPEHRRPPYLNSLGMFDHAVLEARLTLETQQKATLNFGTPPNARKPVDGILSRLSETLDPSA